VSITTLFAGELAGPEDVMRSSDEAAWRHENNRQCCQSRPCARLCIVK